jgi:hypothetical protein
MGHVMHLKQSTGKWFMKNIEEVSDKGLNRYHLVCKFLEAGNEVEKTIRLGQVHLGHKDVDLMTINPLYRHPPTHTATATTTLAELPEVPADTPLESAGIPPSPVAASIESTPVSVAVSAVGAVAHGLLSPGFLNNITGPSFVSGGGTHFASPTNNIDVSSEMPAPFKLPPFYVSRIPPRVYFY